MSNSPYRPQLVPVLVDLLALIIIIAVLAITPAAVIAGWRAFL